MNRKTAIILSALLITASIAVFLYSRSLLTSPAKLSAGTAPISQPQPGGKTSGGSGGYSGYGYGAARPESISFKDDASSNSELQVPLGELTLTNEKLETVRLADIQQDRNLLLVVLRGTPLCPFCSAQTSRLVNNYQKFQDRGAEVAVIFPGTQDDLTALLKTAKLEGQELPFPILVDTELDTINRLSIEGDKAQPSTFIIDPAGRTQFAYVGATLSDRPSIKSLLAALDRLAPASDTPPPSSETTSLKIPVSAARSSS